MLGAHLGGCEVLQAAAVAGIALIVLLLLLLARELHLRGVDHDHERAGVDRRVERGEILGAELVCDDDRQTAEHLILRIHQVPLPVVAGGLGPITLLHLCFLVFVALCPQKRVLSVFRPNLASGRGNRPRQPICRVKRIFNQILSVPSIPLAAGGRDAV